MGAPKGYRHGYRRPAIREAMKSGANTIGQIAEAVGLSAHTTRHHLDRMRRDGEARQVREWGARAAKWEAR